MLMEKVLNAAMPLLEGRVVTDLVIGLTLIGCQLDNESVGVSYVLRENLPNGCSAFEFAQEIIGKSATEVAHFIASGTNDLQRSVAAAVLTAASNKLDISDDSETSPFGIDFKADDTVGMVGYIRPIARFLSGKIKELIVFDKGLMMDGGYEMLSPMELQPELLPKCDVVLLSGTITINGTIDSLLKMCSAAREVVLVGPSTPMYPEGYKGTCLTRLAGSWWASEHKNEIFKSISLAGGIQHIKQYMIKKVVPI
jgi:uncharacterized protein (DUF4213/DUF364 family)